MVRSRSTVWSRLATIGLAVAAAYLVVALAFGQDLANARDDALVPLLALAAVSAVVAARIARAEAAAQAEQRNRVDGARRRAEAARDAKTRELIETRRLLGRERAARAGAEPARD